MADNRLINLFPKSFRPHERFVIEPSGQKVRQSVIDCEKVVFQRPQVVLTVGFQSIKKLSHRNPGVWFLPWTTAQLDQRIRFF